MNERLQFFEFQNQQESKNALLVSPEEMKPLIEKYASLRLLSFSQGPSRNADQQH